MQLIRDLKMFVWCHPMLTNIITFGYVVLFGVILSLSLIIAHKNEEIEMLNHLVEHQYSNSTKIEQSPYNRKHKKKYNFIRVPLR